MYFIYFMKEVATNFEYAELSDKPYFNKEGFEFLSSQEVDGHKQAVGQLRKARNRLSAQNKLLDPGYKPPSRRGK